MQASRVPQSGPRAYGLGQICVLLMMPLVAISLSGCAAPAPAQLTSKNLPDTLSILAQQHHVCGAMVAVIKNRQLDSFQSATGCSPALMLNSDSVFQAASLSKPVFAYAVLRLVAQGKMQLDVPVLNYLPQGYRHQFNPAQAQPSELVIDPRLQAITVRMVLNHTSGLPNWAFGPLRFQSAPGAKWNYSGEGYVLLQRAVEAVTGQALDQFMTAQVFKPLAMHQSNYVWSKRIAQNLIPGTKANGNPRTTMHHEHPNAAYTLYTSAADYARFMVKVLNEGDVLSQITATPVPTEPSLGVHWGLGWGLGLEGGDSYLWHWGNNTGYRAFAMASLQTGDGFVMLTNSENGLKLAQSTSQQILKKQPRLFHFSMLDDDLINVACNTLRVCL